MDPGQSPIEAADVNITECQKLMEPRERPHHRASSEESIVMSRQLEGSLNQILLAATVTSLPLMILSSVLIGLVFQYRVSNPPPILAVSTGAENGLDNRAYFLNYSATRLITVSSWTSTMASFISSFAMALLSYPIARKFLLRSNSENVDRLPSPYQLRLVIELFSGTIGSLSSWFMYCCWKKRTKTVGILRTAATGVVATVFLGFAILAADTWLHVTIATVPFDLVSPVNSLTSQYGRGLGSICDNPPLSPCSAGAFDGPSSWVRGASEAYRTLTNLSSLNTILPLRMGNKTFAYLTASNRNSSLDFQASTFAISTQCESIGTACSLQASTYCVYPEGCSSAEMFSVALTYNCSAALYGDLVNDTGSSWIAGTGNSASYSTNIGFFMQLFADANLTRSLGSANSTTPNPFYFATGAVVPVTDTLSQDPEGVEDLSSNNTAFLLSCKCTVYELTYTSINGTMVADTYSITNDTITTNVGWPFYFSRQYVQTRLESTFIAAAETVSTSQQLAEFFATDFSQAALSVVTGIMSPRWSMKEQTRQALIVAQVPKAPLFTLIAFSLAYSVFGLCLTALAFASQPRKIRDVQARLSIAGLIAALLEPRPVPNPKPGGIETLFAEKHSPGEDARVRVVETGEGRWDFQRVERHSHTSKPNKGEKTISDGSDSLDSQMHAFSTWLETAEHVSMDLHDSVERTEGRPEQTQVETRRQSS